MDAVAAAGRFGIGADRAVRYECDSAGTELNYRVLSEAVMKVRKSESCPGEALDEEWCADIKEDYKTRHK